jgi:hypothetical protein
VEVGVIAEKTVCTTKTKAVVVSHTHWDREWYLPFQKFRMKLVDLIDGLLEILDTEPTYRYFTLDGQTIVLEDYLEVRPENRERLAKYIREGRILIGPWYVLPDEFLVSAESLVRNLLLGHIMAESYGGVMPVGYLPDTFGHPAQIPQILRGFGLDNAIIYRGLAPERSEFLWEAPDGSAVLAVYLPGGYCNAMQLTAAPWRFLDRLPEIIGKVKAMATTDNLLLMNGCDHLPARREIEEIIAQANQRLGEIKGQVMGAVRGVGQTAGNVTQALGWTFFVSIVLGALAALFGGVLGVRRNIRHPLSERDRRVAMEARPEWFGYVYGAPARAAPQSPWPPGGRRLLRAAPPAGRGAPRGGFAAALTLAALRRRGRGEARPLCLLFTVGGPLELG